VGIVAWRQ